MKRKKSILLVVLLMAVGFAAVSTTLYINGRTKINANQDDFNVYYSDAYVNGVQDKSVITDDTHISFTTELSALGEKYVLDYEVTNGSKNYDAELEMVCTGGNDYLSVTNDFDDVTILKAKALREGKLTLELIKSYAGDEDLEVSIECTISANALERESLGVSNRSQIGVEAFDEDDKNLNAKAYEITGTDEEKLLESLAETGYIADASEVDALIEVESDKFDNFATTTFDVSTIAEEGDKVVILHFDEEKQEWEYISEEEVDENGKVTADFTSYSPVAFVVVKSDGTLEKLVETLKFDANGGSVTETSRSVTYGSAVGTLPTPSRTGYTFAGWWTATTGGTKYESTTLAAFTTETTLYARWTANKYTLKFNANGGSVTETSRSVTYDSTVGTLPTPIRTGYTFAGWYTATTGGTKYESTTKVSFTSETTIYAQWKIIKTYVIGEEIIIGTEKFNVIKDNGTTVTMLAQYTLDSNYKQSSTASHGMSFSNEYGWEHEPGPKEIDIQLYDGPVKSYVNKYASYLQEETGDTSITGNLITLAELGKLGCIYPSDYSYESNLSYSKRTCNNSKYVSWLVNGQSWWTRSTRPGHEYDIWYVNYNGYLYMGSTIYVIGVRPTITISKSTLN